MSGIQKLQWSIYDIINECLDNWNSEKYDITLESTKHSTYSRVIVRLRHKNASHHFFKSALNISMEKPSDVNLLTAFLQFLEEF